MTNIITSSTQSDITVKYHSSNPIIQILMSNFLSDFNNLLSTISPKKIIELGAGEGYLSKLLSEMFPNSKLISSDVNTQELKSRTYNLNKCRNVKLEIIDATKIQYPDNSFDLVVCSEVLEHIFDPEKALQEIYRVNSKYALLSVPNEPYFHLLNLLRFKYLRTFGNYPDHINHWSISKFNNFAKNTGYNIVKIKTPFPWVMLLLEK